MGSHSVTCHLAAVTFPPLSEPKVHDTRFSDPGGMQSRVEVGGAWLYPKIVYPRNTVTYLRDNRAVS